MNDPTPPRMTDQAPELQRRAQLEGLAIGLEQRGEKSAAHLIRLTLQDLTRPTPAERPVPQVREALEPFAKAAEQAAWPTFERDNCLVDASFGLRVRDLRKAREALTAERPSDAAVAYAADVEKMQSQLVNERKRAIEDCAKVCDGLRHPDYSSETADWASGTFMCATAIRALLTSA